MQASTEGWTALQGKDILLGALQTKCGLRELSIMPRHLECVVIAGHGFGKRGTKDEFEQYTATVYYFLFPPRHTSRIKGEKVGLEKILNDPEES